MDPDPAGVPARVWWADLTNADLSLVAWLDHAEHGRLERLDAAADRGRFLVGAALLRVATAAATGRPREEITITRTCDRCGQPHGAPRVPGTWVSVAHAGSLVVVATAGCAVGVDVDRADRGGDMRQWVHDEAEFKAASGLARARTDPSPSGLQTLPLVPPLPGYLAALALPSGESAQIVVHDLAASAAALRGRPPGVGWRDQAPT